MLSIRSDKQLEAVVRKGTEDLLVRVGGAFAGQSAWVDQLRAVAYELRDFLVEDEGRARAMVLEAPEGNAETRRIRESGVHALTVLIDLGRGELPSPGSVSSAPAAITAGVIYNRIHVGVEAGVETLDDEMVRELMFTAILPYLGIEAALAELEAPAPPRPG
ncbi:MAG TPA: hypothetical protein VLC07_06575 [Solirubrobacterales bacterium]|nr:hypothetical protein [Solirubrobacterales bacterium]